MKYSKAQIKIISPIFSNCDLTKKLWKESPETKKGILLFFMQWHLYPQHTRSPTFIIIISVCGWFLLFCFQNFPLTHVHNHCFYYFSNSNYNPWYSKCLQNFYHRCKVFLNSQKFQVHCYKRVQKLCECAYKNACQVL